MSKVVIAIVLLLGIVLIKRLPVIGGNIHIALLIAGAATMICSGIFTPGDWILAFIDGMNRIAWITCLALTGGIFAEISNELGTVDTIIGVLNAKFGNKPRALGISIILVLTIAGSLLGDACAAATVIGALTIGILCSMGISPEKISAIIVMGASIGSIMPPMTQAIALASTLCDTEPDPVVSLGYITVAIALAVCCIYVAICLIHKDNKPGKDPSYIIKMDNMTAGEILKKGWKSLIPVCFLIVVILMRTIPVISFDLGPFVLKSINISVGNETTTMYALLNSITIVTGLTNGIVMSIICAIIVAFFFPAVRNNGGKIISRALHNTAPCVTVQLCAAFMLGCFYATGSITAVTEFALALNENLLKVGGAIAMCLVGMLTGSQTTTQNAIFSFFGPALISTGTNPTYVALAGANLAMAGQGMPPADLTTFVVAGLVSAQLNRKCDPVKSMIYSLPMCICFIIIAAVLMYL